MPRIFGLILPDAKRIDYGLTLLKGIGWTTAHKALLQAGVKPETRVKDITEEQLKKISVAIEKTYKVEGDLREEISDNIKRLREIGAYRGTRHARNLPVRGQRTKSNARTKRGKRKTVGALKKEDQVKLEAAKTASK
ncbi:MAG TPA: 30S ribosomal protein S13 [Candidatus Woesebacteria bacterium]|nr:30S ribosomal protein S13 [Candidatus Woesebacteria bacterium]HNS94669.1 30S ribosomal protein S13 [Candidatus Woesebacteria bacterium]